MCPNHGSCRSRTSQSRGEAVLMRCCCAMSDLLRFCCQMRSWLRVVVKLLGKVIVGLLVVAVGRGERDVVSPSESGLPGRWVWLGVVIVPGRVGGWGLERVVVLERCPGPRLVCGVESEAVLWAALIHLLSFCPERGTFPAVARVGAEAVNTSEPTFIRATKIVPVGCPYRIFIYPLTARPMWIRRRTSCTNHSSCVFAVNFMDTGIGTYQTVI